MEDMINEFATLTYTSIHLSSSTTMSSTNNQNTINQLLERVALLEGAVSPILLSFCTGVELISFQARERGLEARVHHGAIQELFQFADRGLQGLTKFVNSQAEELSRM